MYQPPTEIVNHHYYESDVFPFLLLSRLLLWHLACVDVLSRSSIDTAAGRDTKAHLIGMKVIIQDQNLVGMT
jgi:hypothetical protein